MKKIIIVLIMGVMFLGCTIGPHKTIRPDGTVEEHGWLSMGQLEVAEDKNTIYVNKGFGVSAKIPVPVASGFGTFGFDCGYLNSQRLVMTNDAVLIMDVNLDLFDKGGRASDVLIYNKDAVDGYAKYLENGNQRDPFEPPEGVEE